jgi:O-methyltransferase involved in polyketide biosynthesis
MKLDTYAREFLASHPRSMVIHLGCGLDGRCARVPHESAEWYDLDMPEVIDLRRKFYDETDTYHMIASSVTNWGWIDRISAQGRSVLVIAEGLLMYLKEEDVKTLILKLKAAFPGCEIAFDAFSTMTARSVKAHRSLKATGAAAHWGIDDAKAIEQWADGIKLKEEWYFTQSEVVDKLGTLYSLSFKIAGLFPVVNRAHRILYYCL